MSEPIIDKCGGRHEDGLGWNPNGVFCGECNSIDCEGCPMAEKKDI